MTYPVDSFHAAASVLVGHGHIKQRLMKAFEDHLDALGTVRARESVEITANRADHVKAIHFEDGQEVQADQLLLELNADEEHALLAEAAALRDDRAVRHKQVSDMFKQDLISRRELDNAQALLAAAEARVIGLEAAIAADGI